MKTHRHTDLLSLFRKNRRRLRARRARPLPIGVSVRHGGVRFSVFSRNARRMRLVLFEHVDSVTPLRVFELDPELHRFGDIWAIFIEGASDGQVYAWQADGPHDPEKGHRFDDSKMLVDPYARAIVGDYDWNVAGFRHDCPHEAPRSLVLDDTYPWKNNRFLRIPWEKTVIYEVHVRGFTRDDSSRVASPGTFAGFMEKLPYLKKLGVTAVELLPVQAFPENENVNINPVTGERLTNYWGYSTLAFCAVHPRYGTDTAPGCEVEEFKTFVDACHRHGMEVILDIVFNHTAEGDETGPTLSFKGLDNKVYYLLGEDPSRYRNFSGCGNTFNCNHPYVRDFILDVLRYWVVEMRVDGFRFDLASILGRDQDGTLMDRPPLVERIAEDPILRGIKLIAEAWDAGGAYQVGSFPGTSWSEWNGRFRDDVRQFWLTDHGSCAALATRLAGSEDLYGPRGPRHGINFITAHDGFTLRDLVSYNQKHNDANGENNRDGENVNHSFNHGVEGSTVYAPIRNLRLVQMKNLLATLFCSQGVPMLSMGDEIGKTQSGNNNAYCQDNSMNWFHWDLLGDVPADGHPHHHPRDMAEARHMHDFTMALIRFRQQCPVLGRAGFFTGKPDPEHPDVTWHGPADPYDMDWNAPTRMLGMRTGPTKGNGRFCGMLEFLFCADPVEVEFFLPADRKWALLMDTTDLSTPFSHTLENPVPVEGSRVVLTGPCVMILTELIAPVQSDEP